jgi:hypothetical protein
MRIHAIPHVLLVVLAGGSASSSYGTDDRYYVRDGHRIYGSSMPVDGNELVCHKGKKTLSLPASAIQAHLGHGDHRGPC